MNSSTPSIWEKIDLAEYLATLASSRPPVVASTETEDRKTWWARARHKGYWWSLKTVSIAFWVYVPLKFFVGDVDRWIIDNIAPALRWTLDYRFFIFLTLLSIVLLFFRRWIYFGAIVYILTFPLLVILFYTPRLLARQKTWIPAVGVLHVAWLTFRSIRFSVVVGTAFALSALAISIDAPNVLQGTAIFVLLTIWALLLVRACISAVRPVSFIQRQQGILTRIIGSDGVQRMAAPAEVHLKPEIVKLSKTDVDQVVMTASMAVCLYASGHFVAENLEKYRKSGAPVIFSVIGIAFLFAQAIAIFTIANQGLFNISPSQFAAADNPSFATFVRYSLNSMSPGDINAIQPVGDTATWISTYAGFSVGIILLTLVLALIFSVRSMREDAAADAAIAEMRTRSDEYAERLTTEYRLPMSELVQRLIEMGGAVNLWFRFVSDNIGEVRRGIPKDVV